MTEFTTWRSLVDGAEITVIRDAWRVQLWDRINVNDNATFEEIDDVADADDRDVMRIGNDGGNWTEGEFYRIEETEVDMSNFDDLSVFTEGIELLSDQVEMLIKIDGSEELRTDSHSWTERSFDISEFSGETTVVFGIDISTGTGTESREGSFSDIELT